MFSPFDFSRYSSLNFFTPDTKKFRCLDLAFQALKEGRSMPCYMNAANEALVNRFLLKEIQWKDISSKLETLMLQHASSDDSDLDSLLLVDKEAREQAGKI